MTPTYHTVPTQTAINATLTEKEWLAQVTELAETLGWTVYHTHDSRRSKAGFPDLVLVRRTALIFAELKTQRGALTGPQRQWLVDLHLARQQTYVWRPSDWVRVVAILTSPQLFKETP